MGRTAILTDSNSGITQREAEALGITVIPMPFYINEALYFEDITLSQEEFYEALKDESVKISTSMPSPGDLQDTWNLLLRDHEEVLYIPMSSGLSGSCAAATFLAEDSYEGRVEVVNNQRISVTQRQSVLDAMTLAERGWPAKKIKKYLEDTKFDSSIYIMVDTLKYLKAGGRITPTAAAVGTMLHIKPVLQIQGEKLDAYAKARGLKRAKEIMMAAIERDIRERFHLEGQEDKVWIAMAYSGDPAEAEEWKQEVQQRYPGHDILLSPLSLSVSCHIGPGALAITCTKKLPEDLD